MVFDEDPGYLILAKNQSLAAAKEQWVKTGHKAEEFDPKGVFSGSELSQITVHNERRMLKKLQSCCLSALLRYPTTMK